MKTVKKLIEKIEELQAEIEELKEKVREAEEHAKEIEDERDAYYVLQPEWQPCDPDDFY